MKLINTVVLGAALAALAPSAFADRILFGDLSTSGSATISRNVSTNPTTHVSTVTYTITFGQLVTSNTDPHFDQSLGAVINQDPHQSKDFSNFTSAGKIYYVPGASSPTHDNHNPVRYTGRTPAKLTAPGTSWTQPYAAVQASPVVLATPLYLYTVAQAGVTLDLYLTQINSFYYGQAAVTTGSVANQHVAVTGGITGLGYVTESNNGTVKSYGSFTLTNNGTGAGAKTFSADFLSVDPVPEPSSLALLGTGMIGAAGMMFRKRRTV